MLPWQGVSTFCCSYSRRPPTILFLLALNQLVQGHHSRLSPTMRPGTAFLAFALTTLVKGQSSVGPDGITTVATATCTSPMDGATATYAFVDSSSIAYRYACGASTNGGAVIQLQAANSWTQCFNLCDSYTNCTSFTYVSPPRT